MVVSDEIHLKERPFGMPTNEIFELEFEETIFEGLENTPKAFMTLFNGENFGKTLVKFGPDS